MLQSLPSEGDCQVRAVQRASEIVGLLDLLRAEGVSCACEIGSFLGGTLFMLTRMLPDDSVIVSVDWPEASEQMGSFPRHRRPLHEGFRRAGQTVTVLYGDSRSQALLDAVRTALPRPLDFLFIDGDHSLEGVRNDFEKYAPLVKTGGLIGFHDIVADPEVTQGRFGYVFGSPLLWAELKAGFETFEIIDAETASERNGGGIGVLRWPGSH
jgi:predicted O-methyltransferase YrrM